MDKLISIVIPIYNSGKYVSRMLDSILKQKFDLAFVEVICVNDKSTDNSLSILKNYQSKHPNLFKIIDKEINEGVSAARDDGYIIATGKYLVFLDNDDFIDDDYLTTLFSEIDANQLDIVISGHKLVDENLNVLSRISYPESHGSNFEHPNIWGSIHNLNFLRSNNIHYRARVADDNGFVYQEFNLTNKVKFIPYTGYNWVEIATSLSRGGKYNINKTTSELIKFLETFSEVNNQECLYFVIYSALYYFHRSGFNMTFGDTKVFSDELKVLINKIDELYPNWRKMKVNNINYKITLFMFTYKFITRFKLVRLWAIFRVRQF